MASSENNDEQTTLLRSKLITSKKKMYKLFNMARNDKVTIDSYIIKKII